MRGSRSTSRQMTRTQWFVLNRGVPPLPASNTPQCTEEIPHILFVPFKLPAVHLRLTALAGPPVSISLFCLPCEIHRTKALLAYGRLSTCICNHVSCGSNGAMVYFLCPHPSTTPNYPPDSCSTRLSFASPFSVDSSSADSVGAGPR